MLSEWQCEYTKTYRGGCDQEKTAGADVCYFHLKVINGLIDSDPESLIRELPTISGVA